MSQHDKESAQEAKLIDTGVDEADQDDDLAATPAELRQAASDAEDEDVDVGLEDDDEIQKLSSFDKFGRRFVRSMIRTVEDVGSNELHRARLLDTVEDCFAHVIRLSSSINGCQGPVNSMNNSFVSILVYKIEQITESIAQSENLQEDNMEVIEKQAKEHAVTLMREVVERYINQLAQWRKKANTPKLVHQARGLIDLALKLRSAVKGDIGVIANEIEVVSWLGNFLLNTKNAPKSDLQVKVAKDIYSSLMKGKDGAKANLLEGGDGLFTNMLMGLLLGDTPNDDELINQLAQRSSEIAFNDNSQTALIDIHFFRTFYQSITEEMLLSKILPHAQLASRRQDRFIENVAFIVDNLSFKLSIEGAKQLILEIISAESLAKEDERGAKLVASVCKKMSEDAFEAFEAQILRDFLLKTSIEVIRDTTVENQQKVRVSKMVFESLIALDGRASSELVQEACNVFVELVVSIPNDVEIPDVIPKAYMLECSLFNKEIHAKIRDEMPKITTATQANFFVNAMSSRIGQEFLSGIIPTVKKILLAQSFTSTTNHGLILALMVLAIKTMSFDVLWQQEPKVADWLTSGISVISQTQNFLDKSPSRADVNNHLTIIEYLISHNLGSEKPSIGSCLTYFDLTKSQQKALINQLVEYATNESYTCRLGKVQGAVREIAQNGSTVACFTLLEALLVKQSKIHTTPKKVSITEDILKCNTSKLDQRILNCIMIILSVLRLGQHDFTYDQFTLLLQTVCHPVVCPNKRNLKKVNEILVYYLTSEKMEALFSKHQDALVEQFLRRRTGILSENAAVRHIAKNLLVLLSWAGQLEKVLANVGPIFEYKPIQMLNKMEALLKQDFDKISHYDLMFYSEVSKDLLKLFGDRDKVSEDSALRKPVEKEEEEEKKQVPQEPVQAPEVKADLNQPFDFAAMMKKKKKMGKDKKKGKKGAGKFDSKPSKPAAAAAPAQKSAQQAAAEEKPAETKEERNKNDRKQLLTFVEKLRAMKAAHIATCQEILLWSNQCAAANRLNYQDKTLNLTINSLLKLLNLPSTKFSSQFFLDNLLSNSPEQPFFKIRAPIIQCLLAIAQNRLTPRTTQEFQNCLVFLDETANFGDMEGGFLKLTLTIANYVLKDPSVNLSVKEIGLQVTQAILDTNYQVETIDIVRLTINMLKTNYISSNLGLFIRKLMNRCTKLEIAMLLQRLFDYQPVPRRTLLTEVLNYGEPLFCPVWLQTLLWVLLSDEELSGLARKIWNKFGFYLQPQAVILARENEDVNMFHYLRSPNFSIFDLTVKATASAAELFQFMDSRQIVSDMIEFYESEWTIIEKLSFEATEDDITKDQKVQMSLIADDRVNRIAVPKIFKMIARYIKPNDHETVLTFLITRACLDQNRETAQASQQAAIELIQTQGPKHANALLATLEEYIKDKNCSADAKNQAVILLAHLSPFLEDTAQKKIMATIEQLIELATYERSEEVRQSICKTLPHLSRYAADKSKVILREQITALHDSKDERALKGHAYVTAGLTKAKGMKVMQEMELLSQFYLGYFQSKKSDPLRKIASLHLFETLSFSMGHSFELYLDSVFPHILSSISDQKENVRAAAGSALKRIMANFSNLAIKQALPRFLTQLSTDNWRSKISTVEALGNMAFCAPKQISSFLPQIVKGLRDVLNDTHEKVKDAAIQAISKIGSVIKCPEVGDMLEIIIRALANSTEHLREALKLLLETSFVHKIDAPSLSLLVPLLDSGLSMYDNQAKQMASQLMGNICSLTSDPSDLLPYMQILMPAIKNSLFGAIPEIRASAAKAMGSLSKGLGIQNSEEMLVWLREQLNSHNTTGAERLGAAQGFAEMISAHGQKYFEVNVEEVVIKANDKEPEIREAYRSVLLFLATSYTNFVDCLPKLVPLMIEGLADERDEVRKVSMRNVKVCIKQFGKVAPTQLVNPIMRMMFSHDSRVRASSSILMYQLVKELENDIIKAQPKYLTMETKHKILSSMFILRHDQIEAVRTQAGQIWKSIVDNQLIILRQVIDTLIQLIFNIIQSPSQELQEMGLACMRGLVEKFGEKLVNRALDIFESLLGTVTESSQTVGICRVMYNMVGASSQRLLLLISQRLITIMEDNLSSEVEEIRDWSTRVLITMFKRQNERQFIDGTLDKCILYKLRIYVRENRKEEADRLITSLKLMVASAPELRLQDKLLRICEITKKETNLTIAQAQVLAALAPTIAPQVFHKRLYMAVMHSLEEELKAPEIDDWERIQHVLNAYAELMSYIPAVDAGQLSEELMKFYEQCRENNRPQFYIDFISHFSSRTLCDIEADSTFYLTNILNYMNHSDKKLIEKVIAAMTAISKKVSKETQFTFVPLIKESIEQVCVQFIGGGSTLLECPTESIYKKKVPHLALLESPQGVKCLVEIVQSAIMQGNIQVRTDAAYCFRYILDFAPALGKSEIVKICGALIRVANDRFPQELKLQIYYALRLIQTKGGPAAKGFNINMQTTYTKALGDPQSTPATRRLIMENLLLLVQSLPRIDPIVKDLNALVDGTKIDGDQKSTASECLALIIRLKGKAISGAISQTIYKTLTDIISETAGSTNDNIFCNSASALAFLSAYASDASQMQTLFNAFDENENDAITLPLKFAVLINGNDTIDKSAMSAELEKALVEKLVDSAGFEEIDDDPSPVVGGDEDEVYRFRGVLDAVATMLNKFARRSICTKQDSAPLRMVYRAINQSAIFKKLQGEDSISLDSYKLLCRFASLAPIKVADGQSQLAPETAEMTKDILACIQKFYLAYLSKNALNAQDALLNILQLNYDNYLSLYENAQIDTLKKEVVKTEFEKEYMAADGVISDDMKLYAIDILFKKK